MLLSTLSQAGVTPDFLIHHWYPVSGGQDSDQMLLGVTTNFSGAATDLRGQITGYFGPGGTNIELDITENNNDAAPPGKQSVSLVNALYYADSLGQIMQTEFNARIWYQLHDGGPPGTDGDMSTNLYGWRMYGAFGVMDWDQGLVMTNRYPPYFAAELISRFIGAGDTVVQATSDNALVSAYAALRTNGTLALLAINKQPYTNYFVNIALTNCDPSAGPPFTPTACRRTTRPPPPTTPAISRPIPAPSAPISTTPCRPTRPASWSLRSRRPLRHFRSCRSARVNLSSNWPAKPTCLTYCKPRPTFTTGPRCPPTY